MKVVLQINIGRQDATRLEMDRTLNGEIVEVSPSAAKELIGKGWAREHVEPEKLKGVPPVALKAEAKAPTSQAPSPTVPLSSKPV